MLMLWSVWWDAASAQWPHAVAVSACMHACSLIRYVHASSRPQRHSAHDCGMHVTCQAHCRLPVRCQPFLAATRSSCFATQYLGLLRLWSLQAAKYCDQRVCLSVYLYARVCKIPRFQISPDFLYMLPVAAARSSFDGNVRF